jgi:hypothetical protein
MHKTTILFIISIAVLSCKKDDSPTCTTCESSQTPSFELCRESDGTASINGENTGTSYDVYIAGLEAAGATCGN